jgi:hypothetical protein
MNFKEQADVVIAAHQFCCAGPKLNAAPSTLSPLPVIVTTFRSGYARVSCVAHKDGICSVTNESARCPYAHSSMQGDAQCTSSSPPSEEKNLNTLRGQPLSALLDWKEDASVLEKSVRKVSELSRFCNSLERRGIVTVNQVLQRSYLDLREIPGVGVATLEEGLIDVSRATGGSWKIDIKLLAF